MSPVEVSITGQSSIHRYPERGIIYVRIHSTGLSQKEVSDDVRSAAERVAKQFEELYNAPLDETSPTNSASLNKDVGPVTYYTINSLTTSQQQEYALDKNDDIIRKPDGTPLKEWIEYSATITGDAIFQDFVKLSEVATTLSVTKYVSITNTKWILLEETERELITDSVRQAYANALVRARAYADEMGLRTVRATKINDCGDHVSTTVGGSSHGRSKQTARKSTGGMAPRRRNGQSASQISSFTPKDVTLSGSCDVEFEIF